MNPHPFDFSNFCRNFPKSSHRHNFSINSANKKLSTTFQINTFKILKILVKYGIIGKRIRILHCNFMQTNDNIVILRPICSDN